MNNAETLNSISARSIWLYGAGKSSLLSDADKVREYLKGGVFAGDGGRFDYPQTKSANLIVLSFEGSAYRHFDVEDKVKPNADEESVGAKAVYLISHFKLHVTREAGAAPATGNQRHPVREATDRRTVSANHSIGRKTAHSVCGDVGD